MRLPGHHPQAFTGRGFFRHHQRTNNPRTSRSGRSIVAIARREARRALRNHSSTVRGNVLGFSSTNRSSSQCTILLDVRHPGNSPTTTFEEFLRSLYDLIPLFGANVRVPLHFFSSTRKVPLADDIQNKMHFDVPFFVLRYFTMKPTKTLFHDSKCGLKYMHTLF